MQYLLLVLSSFPLGSHQMLQAIPLAKSSLQDPSNEVI